MKRHPNTNSLEEGIYYFKDIYKNQTENKTNQKETDEIIHSTEIANDNLSSITTKLKNRKTPGIDKYI